MMSARRAWGYPLSLVCLPLLLAACSNGTGSVEERPEPAPPTGPAQGAFVVSGTIAGLSGQGLVLQNNGGDDLAIAANGSFSFQAGIAGGGAYNVTVRTQPSNPAQTCIVANGSGTVASSDITNVAVTCTTGPVVRHSIGGTVAGLRGVGLTLQNNGTDDLTIQSDGRFMFSTEQPAGTTYQVTVRTQPTRPVQTCTVANGTGTLTADVTNVQVSCGTRTFPISVSVSGLLGSGLELQNNGGDTLAIAADGVHTFAGQVASGSTYNVTVRTNPSRPTQSCVVAGGTGAVSNVAITNVSVTCTTSSFTIGGTIKGLTGSGLVLQNNGETVPVDSAGVFAFPSGVPSGATYSVAVLTQPSDPTQVCTVTRGAGTVGGGNVTDIMIDCVTTEFTVGGEVEGLAGSGLVIRNNGADELAIAANGRFVFPDSLLPDTQYSVTVATQPSSPAQQCDVSNSTGVIDDSDIDSVRIRCRTIEFSVGGTVSGLTGGGTVLLRNGADIIEVASNGRFVFPTLVRTGQSYSVLVSEHPTNPPQVCFISNGSGIMGTSAIDNVQVQCARFPFL